MSSTAERAAVGVFAALGDGTRLALVRRLANTGAQSATLLSSGARMTRQAIVKHLRVLERAGLVRHERRGREVLYALAPHSLDSARTYLDSVSASWDRALERLRALVEEAPADTSKHQSSSPRSPHGRRRHHRNIH